MSFPLFFWKFQMFNFSHFISRTSETDWSCFSFTSCLHYAHMQTLFSFPPPLLSALILQPFIQAVPLALLFIDILSWYLLPITFLKLTFVHCWLLCCCSLEMQRHMSMHTYTGSFLHLKCACWYLVLLVWVKVHVGVCVFCLCLSGTWSLMLE